MKVRINEFDVTLHFDEYSIQVAHSFIQLCFRLFDLSADVVDIEGKTAIHRWVVEVISCLSDFNFARIS